MEETAGFGSAVGRAFSVRMAIGILGILMAFVVCADRTVRTAADRFVREWISSAAKSEMVFEGMDQENRNIEADWNLAMKDVLVPDDPVMDRLLTEVALPDVPGLLPDPAGTADAEVPFSETETTGGVQTVSLPEKPLPSGEKGGETSDGASGLPDSARNPVMPDLDTLFHFGTSLPKNPITPVSPLPEIPVSPSKPITPEPANPSEPVIPLPETPVNPSELITPLPENPVSPSEPITPEPENPVNPSEPITPEPENPVSPSEPITPLPETPANPSEPVTPLPTDPVNPAEPSEPAVPFPENPSEPAVPDTPTGDTGEEILSCFLMDEAGILYGFRPEYAVLERGCLFLPEECTGIQRDAFLGCGAGIKELNIPASVIYIEEGALAGLSELEWIEVDGGNPAYMAEEGVLFDGTGSLLLAFPNGRTETYLIPPGVTRIAAGAFAETSLSRLDARDCGVIQFGTAVFGGANGAGIRIVVPMGMLELYQEALAGYAVTVTE